MYYLSIAAVTIGLLLAVVGSILITIKAFQQSIVWGLVAFFAPCGQLIFTCFNWNEAKIGFLPMVIGVVLFAWGATGIPYLQTALAKRYHFHPENVHLPSIFGHSSSETKPDKGPSRDAQIEAHRQELKSLQAQFAQEASQLTAEYRGLDAQRKALPPADQAAIAKFNTAAADYQARNTTHKQLQQTIDTKQHELDTLLSTPGHE
jgi:hypothetical protein